jgi:hypothetical protein
MTLPAKRPGVFPGVGFRHDHEHGSAGGGLPFCRPACGLECLKFSLFSQSTDDIGRAAQQLGRLFGVDEFAGQGERFFKRAALSFY